MYSVAETYYNEYGKQLNKLRFVFPNRRAGVFFQKYLSQLIDKPVFLPEITTINQFFYSLTDFEPLDPLDLLFDLYHIYQKKTGIDESFDDFYFWGNILLSDFDELDKYLVDAEKLYSNIVSLKEIEATFGGLEPEQLEAIQSFWANFKKGEEGIIKEAFLKNWQALFPVYSAFKKHLLAKKTGYEGLIYRNLAEKLTNQIHPVEDEKITVFAGFNALNKCEEEIFGYFHIKHQAEFCWDYTNSPFLGKENYASFFMEKYVLRFPQKKTLNLSYNSNVEFKSIAVPSVTGQAYLCNNLMQQMQNEGQDLTEKVLLLSDESLLNNVLYSVPDELPALNITMGYPVKSTLSMALLRLLVNLQKNMRVSSKGVQWNSRDVLDLLQHKWISRAAKNANLERVCKTIVETNQIYWSDHDKLSDPISKTIFTSISDAKEIPAWLCIVLDKLLDDWVELDDADSMAEIEKEVLLFLVENVSRISAQIQKFDVSISKDIMARIIFRAIESQTIPFEGEPLSGLQLMGVLESRTIDFDEIVFLSFNERMFPRRSPDNTFIPYNLRKGYGLTTVEYHDSMYAYYFYRLLQRARKVTLVYNTAQNGMYPGEPSRYLLQLKYLYQVDIKEESITFEPGAKSTKAIEIEHSDEVQNLLQRYQSKEGKFLSASALNTYLDCSLKFYFQYLQGLKEEEEIEEEIDARVFGSIYHQAIEELYKPYEKQMISKGLLSQIAKSPKVDDEIKKAMADWYFKCAPEKVEINGQFRIIFNVLKKYLLKTFEIDTQFAPFQYIKGEQKVLEEFVVNENLTVNLGGYIDRIDEVNNEVRIIDYKTGKADKPQMAFSEVKDIFEPDKKRPKYVFQTLFYMLLYKKRNPNVHVRPGIYFLRNLYSDPFLWEVMQKVKRYESIQDFTPFLDEFELQLKGLLHDLFEGQMSFVQTENVEYCAWCPFKKVCMR